MAKVGLPLYVLEDKNKLREHLPIDRSSQGGRDVCRSDGSLSLLFAVLIWCPFCNEENEAKTHPHVLKYDERGARIGDRYRLRDHIGTAGMMFSQGRFCDGCGIQFRITESDKKALKDDLFAFSSKIEAEADEMTGYTPPAG